MKTRTISIMWAVVGLALLAGACALPPTEEMNNAIEAVTRAENDPNAVLYAGHILTRARNALALMQTEADSKNYDAAKIHAAEAVEAADRAIADGRTGAARAREEAAALLRDLKPVIAETDQVIAAAQDAELPLDYTAINQEFNAACRDAEQAQNAFVKENYQETLDRCRSARAGLDSVSKKLADAALERNRKK